MNSTPMPAPVRAILAALWSNDDVIHHAARAQLDAAPAPVQVEVLRVLLIVEAAFNA